MTTEFLERFADNGGTTLRYGADGRCAFVSPEGCRVHARRPLVCRLYPLGRAVDEKGVEKFAVFPKPDDCGAEFGTDGTIRGFLESQGVGPYLEWSLRYSMLYRRMLVLLDRMGVEGRVEARSAGAPAGGPPENAPVGTAPHVVVAGHRRLAGRILRGEGDGRAGRYRGRDRPASGGLKGLARRVGSPDRESPDKDQRSGEEHELQRTGGAGKNGPEGRAPGHRLGLQGPGGGYRRGLRARLQLLHLGHGHQGLRPGDARGAEVDRGQGAARQAGPGRVHLRPQQFPDGAAPGPGTPERRARPRRCPHPGILLAQAPAAAHRRGDGDEEEGTYPVRRALQPQPQDARRAGGGGEFDVLHLRYNAAHRGAETDIFPYLNEEREKRPGTVAFTATRWGQLLKAKKMPPGEKPLTAADCYRFVLSNPAVDVCMSGAKTVEEMRQNLAVLDGGPMAGDELERVRRIGDFVHGPKRR
ncbi:MAG: YkgJ family cysteine cluster protein [Sphingobacterium sp.]|nr:YkgJ family cysteine cluster protein [Sphingobacterium sp.]